MDPGWDASARAPWYGVALVVLGGAIWVVVGVGLNVSHLICFSTCGALNGTSGNGGLVGYPAKAANDLAWTDVFSGLWLVTIGLLSILIALTAFRRGERWAWFAILIFVLAGVVNSVFDYFEWHGWFTYFFYGLLPALGFLFSTKTFFSGRGVRAKRAV